ncbi:MAG: twin-arginine translocase subunit TatC [Planctomycetes bacterium]|nr:twin-arginine translocase subunit TatC [Planctomycetota bacterium]
MGFFRKLFIPADTNPDDVRMTLGEHLEELRSRIIRALVGLAVGAVVAYGFIGHIQSILIWPVFIIYRRHGYEPVVHTFAPSEAFMMSLKVALIIGIILSAPYSLMQIWGFVAAGLYPRERRWVRSFAPVSIILFFAGALFLIVVVNPLLLDFLLTYQTELPDVSWMMPQRLIKSGVPPMMEVSPESQPAAGLRGQTPIPSYETDPPPDQMAQGVFWLNRTERQLRILWDDQIWASGHLAPVGVAPRNRVEPDLRLSEVIPFTLQLAAAFGIGFQVPVAVAFIAAIGLFSAADMAQYRRHVFFVMAIAAAVITPSPDPFSMMLLLIPMAGLFEAGLFTARRIERKRGDRESAAR